MADGPCLIPGEIQKRRKSELRGQRKRERKKEKGKEGVVLVADAESGEHRPLLGLFQGSFYLSIYYIIFLAYYH